jgi:glycosyltransferase involved in cell wall biosynthesis
MYYENGNSCIDHFSFCNVAPVMAWGFVMKIALITLVEKSGMIHYANQLIKSFPTDIKIVFISGNDEDTYPENVLKEKVSLKKKDFLQTLIKIRDVLKRENPDIIHITSAHWYYFFLRFTLRKWPLVITSHDLCPHAGEENLISEYCIKMLIHDADHIFVHGMTLKEELIRSGTSGEKIAVIPIGDFSFFVNHSDNKLQKEDVVLFFGRILAYKGLNYLLDAMEDVQKQYPVKLVIAGEGDMSPYLLKIAQFNPDLIEIHNYFIPDNEVPKLFQRAKIIVLPYIEASQTGVIPIVYAFKKPVIATSVGAIPEVVEDGKTGILVPPKDSAALRNAIIGLINDENKRKTIAENGYLKMKNELSWDKIAKTTVNIYQKVIVQRRNDENKFI